MLLGLPAQAMVPVPLDPQEDRDVPAAAELGPMEEDAVEEQDRSGRRPLLGRLDRGVGGHVEDRPPEAAIPTRAQRVDQQWSCTIRARIRSPETLSRATDTGSVKRR